MTKLYLSDNFFVFDSDFLLCKVQGDKYCNQREHKNNGISSLGMRAQISSKH